MEEQGIMSNENLEGKRWLIAIAAIVMQLCLGTVYAWSVFKKPLMAAHGWGETSVQVTFMICIGMIGIAAAFGGTLVDKKGPKFVATIGGILFGIGTLLSGLGRSDRKHLASLSGFWFHRRSGQRLRLYHPHCHTDPLVSR